MNRNVTSRFDPNYTLGDWIEAAADELDIDAVSLSSVIGTPRADFGLSDADLDQAVFEVLTAIMARGARPVQGCSDDGGYMIALTRFGADPAGIVDGVMQEWHEAGVDPDIDGIWFGLPRYIAANSREAALQSNRKERLQRLIDEARARGSKHQS